MKAVIIIGLCVLSGFSISAQTDFTPIPNSILDTMIFEIKQGRQCNEVMKAQADELTKQGLELLSTDKALKLSISQVSTLEALLKNYQANEKLLKQEYQVREKWLKQKIKRLWKIVVIESGVILVVLIVLL